ncbi:pyroglutamyl-peptidase I [Ramlibacter sp. USB13]|uniref:Pyrrolidone-carboxylate peptidase n=1 Tax=Ramlibacter cellulosilyticus TaxID=2764187 RepID=A0A923MMN2_9BURK|nr:pyroglutamyl-peptidase I [Ramlibacter cellulosilyticus]MBC5781845.1 pyroglutamyl-peptidase I [Ramlibacter cellulosilyticus]
MLSPPSTAVRSPSSVLVTGFDPFGGSAVNPSWDAIHALNGREIAGHRIVGGEIPTVFGTSLGRLQALMEQHRPRLVICTGQAGGRPAISLERVAINVNDARIPDNVGAKPIDVPIVPDGPAAYFTSLPIKAMLKALLDAGVRAEVSQTAGTFVCNQTFYGLMHLLARPEWQGVRGGLIHVPWLPEQGQPSMRLQELVRGLEIAITTALSTTHDIRKEAGALN